MDLVVDKVMQLEHVDDADRDLAVELVAGAAIEQVALTRRMQPRQFQHGRHVRFARTVEHRRRHRHAAFQMLGQIDDLFGRPRFDLGGILRAIGGQQPILDGVGHLARRRVGIGLAPFFQRMLELLAKAAGSPAQMRFENLPDIHA